MGADGLTLARGDVVRLHHALVSGGEAGRLAGQPALDVQVSTTVASRRASPSAAQIGGMFAPIPARWMAVGATTVSNIRLYDDGRVRLSLRGDADLLPSIEAALRVTVAAAGRPPVTFGGPAAPGAAAPDPSEPYIWTPAESADVAALAAVLAVGDAVTLTFSAPDPARLALDRAVGPLPADSWIMLDLPGLAAPHVSALEVSAAETAQVTLDTPLPAALAALAEAPADALWRLYAADAPPLRVRISDVEPLALDRVRVAAYDERPEYHAAAAAPDAPLPPVSSSRAPRVVSGAIAERLVPAGRGHAVEIALALSVAGDWRAATVLARIGASGPWREAARLVDGAADAAWITTGRGGDVLQVRVVPGGAAAPAGAAWQAPDHAIVGRFAPPAAPSNFLVEVLGDGTRRFRWRPPSDPDLVGFELRSGEAADPPLAWADLAPMHTGLLTADHLETMEPQRAGRYAFALRAVDSSGLASPEVRVVAELGPTRAGEAVLWACPSAIGWPGVRVGLEVSDDPSRALEGVPTYDWAALEAHAWSALESDLLGVGPASGAGRSGTYTPPAEDLGTALTYALAWSGETSGAVVFEARIGASKAAVEAAAWAAYDVAAAAALTSRWVQVRWRLAGDGDAVLRLDHLCWEVVAPVVTDRYLDVDLGGPALPSGWARSGDGTLLSSDVIGHVTDVDVTLLSVAAGTTWSLDLTDRARPVLTVWDAARVAARPRANVTIRGLAT